MDSEGHICSCSVSVLHCDKNLHRSISADVKLNVSCFSGLEYVSLSFQFTVASCRVQLFLCNFHLCETLEVFCQVPSMQEGSFSNGQMQLKLALRRQDISLAKNSGNYAENILPQGSVFPCEVCCEGFNVQSC